MIDKVPDTDKIVDRVIRELSGFNKSSVSPMMSEICNCYKEIIQLKAVLTQIALLDEEINISCELEQENFSRSDNALASLNELVRSGYDSMSSRAASLDAAVAVLNEKSNNADSKLQEMISMKQSASHILNELSKKLEHSG